MSLCIHIMIRIGILCLISTAKYYFVHQLCCLVDITNFSLLYSILFYKHSIIFYRFDVCGHLNCFWIMGNKDSVNIFVICFTEHMKTWFKLFLLMYMYICVCVYIYIHTHIYMCLISDLQGCVCSANSKYWNKDFCTGYKNVYSE